MSEINGLNTGAIQPGDEPSEGSKPSKPAAKFDENAAVNPGSTEKAAAAQARLFVQEPIDFVLAATGEKMSTTPDKLAAFASRVGAAVQAAEDAAIVQRVKREVQQASIVSEMARGEAQFLKPELQQIFSSQIAI